MRKLLILLFIALGLIVLPKTFAKEPERPAGSEDRGPLTKVSFIHYRRGFAKPSEVGKPPKGSSCYSFISNGAKWKTTEDFIINPANSGLSGDFVKDAFDMGVSEWEKYGGNAIFGSSSVDNSASYASDTVDGNNVVGFGPYADSSVIAVTTVWGYFYGSPKTREIVEWDMQLNTFYSWGDAISDVSKMDIQNIATHELGHSAGLADLYETVCTDETMFGYATEGETSKRDLNNGDIKGIQELY